MSKLFTFYNRALEDSALVSVYEHDDSSYELNWTGCIPNGFFRSKEEIDAKIKSGEYEIVEDFRKKNPKDFVINAADFPEYPIFSKLDSCPAFSAILALSKDNFRSAKEFKSVKELKEYVEALEKVFGND